MGRPISLGYPHDDGPPAWLRWSNDLAGLIHHADAGIQLRFIRYTERLAGAGIEPSVGNVGVSFDNALPSPLSASQVGADLRAWAKDLG